MVPALQHINYLCKHHSQTFCFLTASTRCWPNSSTTTDALLHHWTQETGRQNDFARAARPGVGNRRPAAHPTASKNYLNNLYFLKISLTNWRLSVSFRFKFSFSWHLLHYHTAVCNQVLNRYHLPCYWKSVHNPVIEFRMKFRGWYFVKVQFVFSLGIYKQSILKHR